MSQFLNFCVHDSVRSSVTEAIKLFAYMYAIGHSVSDVDIKAILSQPNASKQKLAAALKLGKAKDVSAASKRKAGVVLNMDFKVLVPIAKELESEACFKF